MSTNAWQDIRKTVHYNACCSKLISHSLTQTQQVNCFNHFVDDPAVPSEAIAVNKLAATAYHCSLTRRGLIELLSCQPCPAEIRAPSTSHFCPAAPLRIFCMEKQLPALYAYRAIPFIIQFSIVDAVGATEQHYSSEKFESTLSTIKPVKRAFFTSDKTDHQPASGPLEAR